jgi:hypothetical protein
MNNKLKKGLEAVVAYLRHAHYPRIYVEGLRRKNRKPQSGWRVTTARFFQMINYEVGKTFRKHF